ncbi:hypothetical protein BHE74_00028483, partial [Ensete ventricosum]
LLPLRATACRLLASAAPCGHRRPPLRAGPGRSWPPPCGLALAAPLQVASPWPATLVEGLAVREGGE